MKKSRRNKANKTLKLFIGVIVVALVGSNVYFYRQVSVQKQTYEKEIKKLQTQLKDFGESKSVYVVTEKMKAGQPINKDKLETIQIPATMDSNSYITDPTIFDTTLAKVDIDANSPVLKNMLMPEMVYDGDRYVDIVADNFPVHLKKDDFIDYQLVTPFGETYTVFSKARVNYVEDNSISVKLSPEDNHGYNCALVDHMLNPGTVLNATVYVEPGLQKATVAYYPVSNRVLTNMKNNPNIVNIAKEEVIRGRRQVFDKSLNILVEEQKAIVEGRSIMVTKLLTDLKTVRERYAEQRGEGEYGAMSAEEQSPNLPDEHGDTSSGGDSKEKAGN